MASSPKKELKKLCGALRERADMLANLDPEAVDAVALDDLSDDLRALAVEAEDNAGLSPRAMRRAVWHGFQRYVVAGGILLLILVMNTKIFHDNSIVNIADLAKLVRGIMPDNPDADYYAQLLHWAVAGAFSILLFLLALMVATLIEGVLRLVRFPWVDAVFFAILTLACSGAGLWAYLMYAPQIKSLLYEFIQ